MFTAVTLYSAKDDWFRAAAGLASLVWILFLVSSLKAAEPVEIRIGSYVPAQSVGVRSVIRPWLDAVIGDVEDEIVFREFWGGSLGRNPAAQYDLVRYGILDIAWALPGFTPGQFPQIQITELPYLAETATEGSLATWRLFAAGLIDGLDDVHVIGIWSTEMAAVQLIRPITSLDELRNLRIRTAGAVQAEFMNLFNASPQTMDSIEMNQALQRGSIDGVIQGWTGMRTFRTDQLTHAAYEAPSGAIPFLFIMNKQRWESLSVRVRASMTAHGGEIMAAAAGAKYDELGHNIREEIAARGDYDIYVPNAQQAREDAARVKVVHEEWIRRTPRGREAFDFYVEQIEQIRRGQERGGGP